MPEMDLLSTGQSAPHTCEFDIIPAKGAPYWPSIA